MDKDIIRWRYWNTGDAAVYIVAVCVHYPEGWCAYIGSNLAGKQREEDGVMAVRQYGEYLWEREARPFFQELDDTPYHYE